MKWNENSLSDLLPRDVTDVIMEESIRWKCKYRRNSTSSGGGVSNVKIIPSSQRRRHRGNSAAGVEIIPSFFWS